MKKITIKNTEGFRLIGSNGISYDSRFYFEDRGFIRYKVRNQEGRRIKGLLSPFIDSLHRVERIENQRSEQ